MASLFKIKINDLKGVGSKSAEALNALNIHTIGDIINFFPRTYEDWSLPVPLSYACLKKEQCVKVNILTLAESFRLKSGKTLYRLKASDGTDFLNIIFFGSKYAAFGLKKGSEYILRGNVVKGVNGYEITAPKVKEAMSGKGIFPVYHQSGKIGSGKIARLVKNALDLLPNVIADTLPESIIEDNALCSLDFALKNIHFPHDKESLNMARQRIVFEEFFVYQLSMAMLKKQSRNKTGIKIAHDYSEEFKSFLPFKLTDAQKNAMRECIEDMQMSGLSMNRLLQGDVGSGKTAVAAALAYTAAKNGYQVAVMAPTEILAQQHLNTFANFLDGTGLTVKVLSGSMRKKEKDTVKAQLVSGIVDIAIGTHALISESVLFKNLGLIITDEQHRFGVKQREALINKGDYPHTLVMSATPIPRTLAMIVYGDLDISVLNESVPGRQKIDTFYTEGAKRERAWDFLKKAVLEGGQCYIVCASIEENENDIIDVNTYKEKIINHGFRQSEVEVLHGKIPPGEKSAIMARFINNEIKILISTTVIEVGVDVPNASVIIIENAERFGISQLHQLRGRVGRGTKKSYCILLSDSKSVSALRRFKAMAASDDGFYLSEEDLKMRGPGDFFGVNQHGIPNVRIATTYEDIKIMKSAQKAVESIICQDPELLNPGMRFIKYKISNIFKNSYSAESKNIVF